MQLEPAYVLRALAYRETSLLLELWSRRHGRVSVVARAARVPRSRTAALLQPLRPLLLSWTQRGELGTLTGVEAAGPPPPLTGEGVICGWYVNELLLKLLQRHDPHHELFDAYVAALSSIPIGAEVALRRFELSLLSALGYGLQIPQFVDPQARYRYHAQLGLLQPAVQEAQALSGQTLIDLRADQFGREQTRREARELLRAAIAVQLDGRELKTARLLRELRSRQTSSNKKAAADEPGRP